MASTAPYTNAMRVGQGFNTYTQEIRLENAVQLGSKGSGQSIDSMKTAPRNRPLTPPLDGVAPRADLSGEVPVVSINGVKATALEPTTRNAPSPPPTPGSERVELGSAIDVVSAPLDELPFELPSGPVPTTSQSVTYSTRAIENVSDIMDALNISTSASIKYGTIQGNGSASFVNENKVLDSELNYIVSVIVNNDARAMIEDMEFQEIPGLPLDRFTEVYGDSFISGFTEGGTFNAVISIKLNDKSKHKAVKQAVDVQLAVGPPTLEVGASESIEKEHAEALKNTEISISVNWVGGGEIKKPKVPWTIKSVVAVANAFPSMVARSSARTQAILTRYNSLRSFQAWKWKRLVEERRIWESDSRNQKGGENNKDGRQRFEEPVIILNYVPCALYTADLFDALMAYKKLWKKIGEMLHDTSKYKLKPMPKEKIAAAKKSAAGALTSLVSSPVLKTDVHNSPISTCQEKEAESSGMERAFTFAAEDGKPGWNLIENNMRRDPIPPEPVALSEARLLCREAMTLITEEASRLVDHPHLAYAEFDEKTKQTRMKRPNYAYPQVLKERLPIPIHDDILSDLSTDGAYLKTAAFAGSNDIWFDTNMVGDPKANDDDLANKFGHGAKYEDFSTLEHTEPQGTKAANPLRRIAIHKYRHSTGLGLFARPGIKQADEGRGAIGAIGIALTRDSEDKAEFDECTKHFGHLRDGDKGDSSTWKFLNLGNVDITKIDIAYCPGSGYISGLTFYDQINEQETERLSWRQWEGKEPEGLRHISNEPPNRGDGTLWKFVGLAGSFVDTLGQGHVLARVSGVWKQDGEESF